KKNVELDREVAKKSLYVDLEQNLMRKLGDYSYRVVDNAIEYVDGNFIVAKEDIWCAYYAKNLEWFQKEAAIIKDLLDDEGKYVGWQVSAFNQEDFCQKLSNMCISPLIRKNLDKLRAVSRVAIYNNQAKIAIMEFIKAIR
ncbi:MAG: hypothetical protein K2I71_03895, partial [Helicobacter sp.]|nr:hypothetical protein [Helicobacter sp.]